MSVQRRPIVAIDGPAGAGKSTVARRVSERLGYVLVDTGSLYRTIALAAVRQRIEFDDVDGVAELAEALARTGAVRLESVGGAASVLLHGEDVSGFIRTPEISQGASKVSAVPRVRAALLEMQRAAGRAGGVVLEGRDIGSVVFPEAEVKVFLTASVDERARRRHAELLRAGTSADIDAVRGEVVERDRRDSTRPIAPLVQAKDAIVVDSSALGIDDVVDSIVALVKRAESVS
ncbi:MAG TPA: (d)CMP kinase [Polyangiaceae bacterium]